MATITISTESKLIQSVSVLGKVDICNADQEVCVLGEGVYQYVRSETMRALHYYMGVGGADRFLSCIPVEQWEDADRLSVMHVKRFCKCGGSGCVACRLMNSANEE